MNTDVNELLEESIRASNRTTHAVRAFVKIFLIQLSTATVVLAIYFLATISPSGSSTFLVSIAVITWLVWAISVGWTELGLSKIPLPGSGSNSEKSNSKRPDDSISNLRKEYQITTAEHKLWLEAGSPDLSAWDAKSDFAQWLASR